MLRRSLTRSVLTAFLLFAALPSFAANHLGGAKSRYLIEHADNPVDWYPWSDGAFAKAQREGKPVYLSIGYASCHWCHVMERETFENAAIAKLLNEHFVAVLVDREEHPEVDATYMAFVQAMTGSGGWPANLIVTADRKPLFGATYMRPEAVTQLLTGFSEKWKSDRASLLASGDSLISMVRSLNATPVAADVPAQQILDTLVSQIHDSYDAEHGGFGAGGPKFPQPLLIDFLLRYSMRGNGDAHGTARAMAVKTLNAMANGSIYDQIGGGFHRYTTDPKWREPHYEKMLYDQALNAIAYTEAWQLTKDDAYAEVVRGTLDYVLRSLRDPKTGGFDSGQDADSLVPKKEGPELVEGASYGWTPAEIARIVGPKAGEVVSYYYGITAESSLPYIAHTASETRKKFSLTEAEFVKTLTTARQQLLTEREKRPQPFRDDKVLAGWNGLMISALARGGAALGEPRYIDAAAQAARFVQARLYDAKTKKLSRRYRAGSAGIDALPEDYAMLIQGVLDAYEASFDTRFLDFAAELQARFDERFWNEKEGRYMSTTAPIAGITSEGDSPIPSANSLAVANLLRLGEITDSGGWRARAMVIVKSHSGRLAASPIELPQLASALSAALTTPKQIVVAGDPRKDETRALLRIINERFVPNRVLLLADGAAGQKRLAQWLPFVRDMKPIDEQPTAYICEHYACKMPTSDPNQVIKLLEQRND
ncbi:MAG: hypothetical protein JWO56_2788 [Acidobacteria bacterium]|nr:hypothetical protein [Acidobacteriota bacterium]